MRESLNSFLLALFYGITSISIVMFNKTVFAIFEFHFSVTLTLGQMITAIVLLFTLRSQGLIQFPSFDIQTALTLLPLSIFFNGMVLTGLGALMYLNVPMYSALRRFTTFMVMGFEIMILGKNPPTSQMLSVVAMVFGAVFAGLTDLTFNLKGYILVFLNCIVTAFYLIYIEKKKKEVDIGAFGLMFYNNVLSIPIVVVLALILEIREVIFWPGLFNPGFILSFLASCVLAFLLNYSIFVCTMYNSPLATSVTGQIKNIVCDMFGLFLFGDVVFYVWNIFGLLVSGIASAYYSFLKYQQITSRKEVLPQQLGDVEKGDMPEDDSLESDEEDFDMPRDE